MEPLTIGFVALGAILALIGLGVPIGLALGAASFAGLWAIVGMGPTLSLVGNLPYEFGSQFTFTAIPMFIVMGTIAFHSGMTESLFRAARLWLGGLPGGLAIATNFACAGFGAASGSSLATAVAMGRIAIPEMLRYRYDPGLATAVCACGGTIAALIPPSIAFVIYGVFAQQSISKLFIAGIVPGLITAALYAAMIATRCALNPTLAPPVDTRPEWRERLLVLREIWPLPILILGVMGSIYMGLATPTEAAAIGAVAAFFIALLQGRMTLATFRAAAQEAILATASIFFVAVGAIILTKLMTFAGLPDFLAASMREAGVATVTLLIGMSVIYLVLGMFLDPLGIILLTVPIFLPMFKALGLDLIWFGVIVVKYIEIGLITPPVGLNVYAIKSLVGDRIALGTIFRGCAWFLVAEAIIMTLLIAFPGLSLYLPSQMD
jgi:tripartite ATP-independent transporter DctM subunit